jgi:hypothetical protein
LHLLSQHQPRLSGVGRCFSHVFKDELLG